MISKLLQATQVIAADNVIKLDQGGDNVMKLSTITIPSLISTGINLIMVVVGIAFFAMLVLGGLKWVVSEGDKNNVEGARNQVTNALIGLAIVFSAWAILRLISTVFGINLIDGLVIPTVK